MGLVVGAWGVGQGLGLELRTGLGTGLELGTGLGTEAGSKREQAAGGAPDACDERGKCAGPRVRAGPGMRRGARGGELSGMEAKEDRVQ